MHAVTMTEMQPVLPVQHLLLWLRLQARVLQAVEEMRASDLLPLEQLNEFLDGFLTQNPDNMQNHELISLQFAYLIYRVIDPQIEVHEDNIGFVLLGFRETVMGFLKQTVPQGETVEQFIQTYKKSVFQYQETKRRFEVIHANSAETMRLAVEKATSIRAKILANFMSMKRQLCVIHAQNLAVSRKVNKALRKLEKRIDNASATMMQISQNQSYLADQMEQDLQNFAQIVKLYEKVLKKV